MANDLESPYPYFGGKSKIAARVWELLGDPHTYIEPFFGSGAVLLKRPSCRPNARREIANDYDGMIANFWRAVKYKPAEVRQWADYPCLHNDILPRRRWLKERAPALVSQMAEAPDFCDPKAAGWWGWLMCHWIGASPLSEGLAPADGIGKIPRLDGTGLLCQKPAGDGLGMPGACESRAKAMDELLAALSDRLRDVKVVCGDWSRVLGGEWVFANSVGIFLDPPYGGDTKHSEVYTHDSTTIAAAVRDWCLANGNRPNARIVLAGYDCEHDALLSRGWRKEAWKANGGYANQAKNHENANCEKERLWISPNCAEQRQLRLF